MKLLVVGTAPFIATPDGWVAYSPLVMEMDLWFDKVDHVTVMAPTSYDKPLLTKPLARQDIKVVAIPAFDLNSFGGIFRMLWALPIIKVKMLIAMAKADHIHLRCPGNIGLISSWIQLLFPRKIKTAKYAGNWDPESRQPRTYRLQKYLLSNSFLTRNMQVLVYGDWPNQSKNIKPFFTATYWEKDKEALHERSYTDTIQMVYLGTLSANKRVDYAIELMAELKNRGISIKFDVFGAGAQQVKLKELVVKCALEQEVVFHGNQPKEVVTSALKNADFAILPSKSEGWPKAVAEAMFWGAIPLASAVSCVPWMLDYGKRGVLLDFKTDAETIQAMLTRPKRLRNMSAAAAAWSRQYTLDKFESEIEMLLK